VIRTCGFWENGWLSRGPSSQRGVEGEPSRRRNGARAAGPLWGCGRCGRGEVASGVMVPRVAIYGPLLSVESDPGRRARMAAAMGDEPT
jgi:hypothetical protein